MHDGRPLLLGDAPGQLVAHPLHDAAVVDAFDLHLLVLPAPALELPLDVPLVPSQIAQPDRVGVDGMQRGQRVGHVGPDGAPGRLVERGFGLGRAAQDVALDELHHVEGPLVDRLVGAEPDGDRNGDPRRPERVHEPVLAGHVVRGRQDVVQGGSAQGPGPSLGVLHAVGEVGAAAGDQRERERRSDLGNVRHHPLGDLGLMDAFWRLRHANDANRCGVARSDARALSGDANRLLPAGSTWTDAAQTWGVVPERNSH